MATSTHEPSIRRPRLRDVSQKHETPSTLAIAKQPKFGMAVQLVLTHFLCWSASSVSTCAVKDFSFSLQISTAPSHAALSRQFKISQLVLFSTPRGVIATDLKERVPKLWSNMFPFILCDVSFFR